jgi:hypothetical protein
VNISGDKMSNDEFPEKPWSPRHNAFSFKLYNQSSITNKQIHDKEQHNISLPNDIPNRIDDLLPFYTIDEREGMRSNMDSIHVLLNKAEIRARRDNRPDVIYLLYRLANILYSSFTKNQNTVSKSTYAGQQSLIAESDYLEFCTQINNISVEVSQYAFTTYDHDVFKYNIKTLIGVIIDYLLAVPKQLIPPPAVDIRD